MNIEIISGSPREASLSNRVARFLKKQLLGVSDHQVNIIDVRDWNLPPMQEVWTSVEKTPFAFQSLAKRMFQADAFILVSPEFNGSYTPAMKNLLDHFPKQHRKTFGIVTASPGAMGGIRASQQMQLLVGALFGILAPHMLIVPAVDEKFDENANLLEPSFQKAVDSFVGEFLWLAESVAQQKLQSV